WRLFWISLSISSRASMSVLAAQRTELVVMEEGKPGHAARGTPPPDRPPRSVGSRSFKAGFRASKLSWRTVSSTFPGNAPSGSSRDLNVVTVAGAAPASHRLPNYLSGIFAGEHPEHLKMSMGGCPGRT